MKVLIFTEGGNQIGLGHISRCSSLYDELDARGVDAELIIFGDTHRFEMLKEKKYKVTNWMSSDFLNDYLKENDYCIVDSYLADEDVYNIISDRSKNCIYIDDNSRIKYPKGIVVNPSLSTKRVKYPSNDTNRLLIGPDFIILRSPFIDKKRESLNDQVKEVLITIGGSDIHDLTPKIVSQLSKTYPELTINVVIGSAFKNIDQIKKYCSKNIKIYENATAEEMKSIMIRSDIAVTAAGQTIYELIATQTPFIPIKVIENQENNIITLKEHHLTGEPLDYYDSSFIENLLNEFENLMTHRNRVDLVKRYNKVIDGLGSKRIIDALILGNVMEGNYYIRKVKEEDIFEVFKLSNEDYVRKYSINTEKIGWEDHKVWFDNIMKSERHVFYVLTDNTDNFLGQLRYKIENQSAIVSISLCKSIKGKGLSKKFLEKSLELIFEERNDINEIIAYVSHENIASKKLFQKAGFLLFETNNGLEKYVY